jgi:hypothetical protein
VWPTSGIAPRALDVLETSGPAARHHRLARRSRKLALAQVLPSPQPSTLSRSAKPFLASLLLFLLCFFQQQANAQSSRPIPRHFSSAGRIQSRTTSSRSGIPASADGSAGSCVLAPWAVTIPQTGVAPARTLRADLDTPAASGRAGRERKLHPVCQLGVRTPLQQLQLAAEGTAPVRQRVCFSSDRSASRKTIYLSRA